MRILLTRPREDSEKLAGRLEAMGHQVTIEPVIAISFESDASIDLEGVQALIFTSANGVRAFAQRSPTRDLPAFAVGDATAAAAHEFGFTHVESAGGDVTDLARLVRENLRAQNGALLHAAGSVVAGDLASLLGEVGFAVRRTVLYRADPLESLSAETTAALGAGQIDVITFFSPRSASIFADLVRKAGLESVCASIVMVGLSPAVATAAELPWRRREIATAPTEAALVDVIAKLEESGPKADANASAPEPSRPVATVSTPTRQAQRAWLAPVSFALVLAAAALGWTAWREFNRPPDTSAALLQAQQRLETLERESTARIAALERDVGSRLTAAEQSRAAVTRNVDAAVARLGALESRISAVSKQFETTANQFEQLAQETRGIADPGRLAALTTENRRLAQELARLQEEVASMNGAMGERVEPRRESIVVAIGSLRDAIARGVPYAAELASAHSLAADDSALLQTLAPLDAGAARGIPTRSALKARFDRVATDIVRAGQSSDDGWRHWLGRLMTVVSIRPVGDVEGDTPGAIAARAERRADAEDLAGAVAELGKLSGPSAEAARAWLADARERVNAESALANATAQALKLGAEAKAAP